MAQIFQLPKPVAIDSNLQLMAGAKAEFYQTGTSTPQNTYQDHTLTTPHANPVVADAAGKFPPIWFNNGLPNYKLVLKTAADVTVYTVDPCNQFILSQSELGATFYPRTAAEISAGVTPTYYFYPAGVPFYDARRYGLATAASAATNSTALQAACDVAKAAGGGTVVVPAGTFNTDAPIIVPSSVSIVGADEYGSILKKTTNTASTVSDATVRRYDSATVGYPICVLHLVEGASTNWSGTIRNLRVRGDTSSPNTTAVTYGIFACGLSNGHIHKCIAEFVQVGFFLGAGSDIYSTFTQNVAIDCQRGFYCHGATSLTYANNYANRFRYIGHALSSMYYSTMFANATDGGGYWRTGTTDISTAYEINASVGSAFIANGCETQNGSVWRFTNNTSLLIANNLALDVTSDYTGGSDVVLLESDTNISCVFTDNRAKTIGMTGTGARHFMYKITSMLGDYIWARNRFVDAISDSTNTSTWANTSGTVKEWAEDGSATGTLTGCTTSPTGTLEWTRIGNIVILEIPSITATSNTTACTITGLPASVRPVAAQTIRSIVVTENSAAAYGNVVVGTDGVLTLSVGAAAAGFTASGTKGINSCTIPYRLA